MTAKTDLDNALSILDAGITAHVTALKNSKAVAATAQAAANDDTYVTGLTAKVLKWADTLSASNPVAAPVAVAPVVAAVVAAPVAVVAPVAAPVALEPVVTAATLHDPGATPAMIAAAQAAAHAAALAAHPAAGAPAAPVSPASTFAAIEAALHNLVTKK